MAGSCLPIKTSKNIRRPCIATASGVRPVMYMGFISQIASVVYASDGKTITDIILKSGEKLTVVEGYKLSNDLGYGFNSTDTANYLPHDASFVVYDQTATGLTQVDILANITDMFMIAKQNGLNGQWRVLGINSGMSCTGITGKFNDANGGAAVMTFQAPQELVTPAIYQHKTASLDDSDSTLSAMAMTDA